MSTTHETPPEENSRQIISTERFYELVDKAYTTARSEKFNATDFIESYRRDFENIKESPEAHIERTERLVFLGEVLSLAVNEVDWPPRVDEYEELKKELQSLSSEQRSFCRQAVTTDSIEAYRSLPNEREHGDATTAQLMAILS